MRRRSRAGSVKARRRKPAAPKRPGGPEAARPHSSSAASQESEIARLNRELAQARQEQTATADVLGIISSSSSLERVFETILETPLAFARLTSARFIALTRMAAFTQWRNLTRRWNSCRLRDGLSHSARRPVA